MAAPVLLLMDLAGIFICNSVTAVSDFSVSMAPVRGLGVINVLIGMWGILFGSGASRFHGLGIVDDHGHATRSTCNGIRRMHRSLEEEVVRLAPDTAKRPVP